MKRRALMLGSGGNAAFAWQVGLVAGMAEAGLDIRDADALVGTSAGARLAVQLAAGDSPQLLLHSQLEPRPKTESAPPVNLAEWRKQLARTREGTEDPAVILRRVGALSLATAAEAAGKRRQSIESLISTKVWPSRRLQVVAVEAESGQRTVFDASSGIALLDAVVASGAVPGIFPPVCFRGRHYFDGGFYSTENADVALGYERVLILGLRSRNSPLGVVSLEESLHKLRAAGAQVRVIHPDEATEAAFASVGRNVLDPAVAGPAARAAHLQGTRIARADVAAFWN